MNSGQNNHAIVKDIGLKLLSEGKSIRIKAHGYSMYPCIKPGSLILIEPISIKGLPRPGEIIAVRRENGLIAHRLSKIINKNGINYYIARGDSNACLLYTSDAADDLLCVDLGGRRIIK